MAGCRSVGRNDDQGVIRWSGVSQPRRFSPPPALLRLADPDRWNPPLRLRSRSFIRQRPASVPPPQPKPARHEHAAPGDRPTNTTVVLFSRVVPTAESSTATAVGRKSSAKIGHPVGLGSRFPESDKAEAATEDVATMPRRIHPRPRHFGRSPLPQRDVFPHG